MGRIVLQSVRKAFGEVVIIPSIDLEIADGEFVVFVGPSCRSDLQIAISRRKREL